MSERSAVSTIIGYFYQFDYSILSILNLGSDEDFVDIECIEDVDIYTADETTAVQCKYYEGSEYNHSVIKPAIIFMFSNFIKIKKSNGIKIKYALKGYFASGQEKLPSLLDTNFLKKNFLTYTEKGALHEKHIELGASEEDLQEFLDLLNLDINAKSFEEQLSDIKNALANIYKCSAFASEYYHYNSALREIKELSINKMAEKRRIKKYEFLKKIDNSKILFDEWFVARKGKKKFYQELREEYFSSLNVVASDRLFLIHVSAVIYGRGRVKHLIKTISKKYSNTSKRAARPYSPYVLLVGISQDEIIAIKQEIYNEGIRFSDGYNFKGSAFDPSSISRLAFHGTGPDLRFFNNLEEAHETFGSFQRSREVYEFYVESPVGNFLDQAVRHIKLHVPDYGDILEII